MGKTLKKISSVLVSTVTVVSLSGASLLVPATALAQVDQIQALLAQIAQLQAQLLALQAGAGATVAAGGCSFTRDLTVGAKGDDVKCLQTHLTGTGHFTFSGGATGYFGSVTKTAVAAWQAANSVSPAAGYFGAKSRAKYASAGGTVAAPTTPGQPVIVPGAGLSVMNAISQPSGSAIAGAGQIDVARWTFTASAAGGVSIADLKLTRTGVVSDSNISNLYLADEQGVIFAQYSSLNNGLAQFNGVNLNVGAGQSRTATLRMDLSSSASAGNTLGWQLSEVKLAGGGPVSGLPLSSPTLTVTSVSNPSLATATYTYVSTGSTVDAGTNGFLIHSATLNAVNSSQNLKSVKYTLVGSANKSDIANVTLKVNGKIVATVASTGGSETLTIVPTETVTVATGNSNIDVYADVMGSPNRTIGFNVLRPYDMVLTDTQYNVNITPTVSGTATSVTINQGRVTVSKATDTPTGNVPAGSSNVTLAKFTLYAGGEPVKMRFLPVRITATGTSLDTEVSDQLRNISVVDDVGNQVGSTISTPSGNWGSVDSTAVSFAANFGTDSSYINYVVPANTTRVLAVKSDIRASSAWDTGDTLSTLQAILRVVDNYSSTNNLEGQISFQTADSGSASGNSLTVVTSPLTVRLNSSVGTQTYVAGVNNIRIGAFVFNASSAEAVKVSSITFDKDSNANFDIQNFKVMIGGTQFGTTQAIVSDAETAMAFSGSQPLVVPAGGSLNIDIFADILTTSSTAGCSACIDVTTGSAIGASSNSSVTWPAAVSGQSVTIVSAPTLTVTQDSDDTPARYITMGSTDNTFFKIRMTVNDTEDVRITDLTFSDTVAMVTGVSGTLPTDRMSLSNVRLYEGDTLLAGPVDVRPGSDASTTATIVFSLGNASPLIVPKNSSKTLTVKGDVATLTAGAVSNQQHTLSLGPGNVTAYGSGSSSTATISRGTPIPEGRAQVVYRTTPRLSASVLGAVQNRIRTTNDEVSSLNWSAAASDDVIIGTVSLNFSGAAVSLTAGNANFAVRLIDPANSNSDWGSSVSTNCTEAATAGGTCTLSMAPLATVSRGTTKTIKVRINSTNFANAANSQDGMSVSIGLGAHALWEDRTSTAISWEAGQMPMTLISLGYE